jgi:hypothetical protein
LLPTPARSVRRGSAAGWAIFVFSTAILGGLTFAGLVKSGYVTLPADSANTAKVAGAPMLPPSASLPETSGLTLASINPARFTSETLDRDLREDRSAGPEPIPLGFKIPTTASQASAGKTKSVIKPASSGSAPRARTYSYSGGNGGRGADYGFHPVGWKPEDPNKGCAVCRKPKKK